MNLQWLPLVTIVNLKFGWVKYWRMAIGSPKFCAIKILDQLQLWLPKAVTECSKYLHACGRLTVVTSLTSQWCRTLLRMAIYT